MLTDALAHTARAAQRRSLAGLGAVAAASAVVAEAKGGASLPFAMTLATVVAASSVAYAVEDEAAETMACSPTPLGRRRTRRVAVVLVLPLAGWAAAAAIAIGSGDARPFTAHRAVVAIATAGVAACAAASVERRGDRASGDTGVITGVAVAIGSTVAASRYRWLPSLLETGSPRPWLVLALVGWTLAAWWSRDPAARLSS